MAVDSLNGFETPPSAQSRGKRIFLQKSLSVASLLIGLRGEGHVVDAETIAASILVEEVACGRVGIEAVESTLGPIVSSLVVDTLSVRHLIEQVEIFDDASSRECREACMSKDVRAVVSSLAYAWDGLAYCGSLPKYKQQQLALEASMIYIPLGHVLGLGHMANQMENVTLRVLFPQSVKANEKWLFMAVGSGPLLLKDIKKKLRAVMQKDGALKQSVDRIELHDRVKSLGSFMRKVLSLNKIHMGGKRREEIFDVLGLRVVVFPKQGADSEAQAIDACYRVRDILHSLWLPVPGREKDYISHPKPNGYRSLHTTLRISFEEYKDSPLQMGLYDGEEIASTECDSNDVTIVDAFPIGANSEESQGGDNKIIAAHVFHTQMADGEGMDADELDLSDEFLEFSVDSVMEPGSTDFFEVQIRTHEMDVDAREGGSAHVLYKSGMSPSSRKTLRSQQASLLDGDTGESKKLLLD